MAGLGDDQGPWLRELLQYIKRGPTGHCIMVPKVAAPACVIYAELISLCSYICDNRQ